MFPAPIKSDSSREQNTTYTWDFRPKKHEAWMTTPPAFRPPSSIIHTTYGLMVGSQCCTPDDSKNLVAAADKKPILLPSHQWVEKPPGTLFGAVVIPASTSGPQPDDHQQEGTTQGNIRTEYQLRFINQGTQSMARRVDRPPPCFRSTYPFQL